MLGANNNYEFTYFYLDTSDDSSDQLTITTGTSWTDYNRGPSAITKSTEGYLFAYNIDNHGTYFYKSENGGTTWSEIDPGYSFLGAGTSFDPVQLFPLSGGDVLAIYEDSDLGNYESTLRSFRWDESADSWDDSGDVKTIVTDAAHENYYSVWEGVQREDEYDVYLGYWDWEDLKAYKYSSSANSWSSLSTIVSNSNCYVTVGMAADVNNDDLYAVYASGASAGSVDVYYKKIH